MIIALAGERAAVTVATNMAGRGTDIKLGGNFEHRLNKALEAAGLHIGDLDKLDEIAAIRAQVKERCDKDQAEVLACGGLYVLGTERHEARRIDNQLRGRSGRQGDVGESRFYLSLQDDLMRIFYRDWVTNAMERLGMAEGVPIESGMVTRAIARAQKKVEDRNFEVRKNLLEYDEVMDQQRHQIYSARQKVLEAQGTKEMVLEMLQRAVTRSAQSTFFQDAEGFRGWFQRTFGVEIGAEVGADAVSKDGNVQPVLDAVGAHYEKREVELTPEILRQLERYILLNAIDGRWKDHLHAIDALKAGIGLRGYGQVDPKTEYKREGFQLFEQLLQAIEDEVTSLILRIKISRPGEPSGSGETPAPAVPPPKGIEPSAAARLRAAAQRRPTQYIPASRAFDVAKRQQRIAAAQQQPQPPAQPAPQPAAENGNAAPGDRAPGQPPGQPSAPMPAPSVRQTVPAVGRNDPCPCGSGQKYKKCHGRGG
jgi:preprotein translocase subunit SecA